jgi:hypothetical protein
MTLPGRRSRWRIDGLIPVLVVALLLLQYVAVGHVLSHLGIGPHGLWAGAPHSDDRDGGSGDRPGGCEAPQLHAAIDGTPLPDSPELVVGLLSQSAYQVLPLAITDRTFSGSYGRGPPSLLL